jgi:hypothetical protein
MASREGLRERRVNTSKEVILAFLSHILTGVSPEPGGAMGALSSNSVLK